MCIADWQLGRLIRSLPPRAVGVGGTSLPLAVFNKDRVAISFAAIGQDVAVVTPRVTATALLGFPIIQPASIVAITDPIFAYTPHLHFTLKDHGDLPMQAWNGISSTTGVVIIVIEYLLPEDVLSLTPDELRKRAK